MNELARDPAPRFVPTKFDRNPMRTAPGRAVTVCGKARPAGDDNTPLTQFGLRGKNLLNKIQRDGPSKGKPGPKPKSLGNWKDSVDMADICFKTSDEIREEVKMKSPMLVSRDYGEYWRWHPNRQPMCP